MIGLQIPIHSHPYHYHFLSSECGFTHHDVIFALPVSPSVTEQIFETIKTMLKTVIKHSDVDSGKTRIGLFVFDTQIRSSMTVNLNALTGRSALMSLVDSLPYIPSIQSPSLAAAMTQLQLMFTSTSSGNRRTVADIGFLVIDKSFNMLNTIDLAVQLRGQGIRVDVAAVGYQDITIPALFSYTPENVYMISDYTSLGNLLPNMIHHQNCSKLL